MSFSMSAPNFSWHDAPLSSIKAPLLAGAGYVLLVLFLNKYMSVKGRGINTRYLQAGHNMILCLGSLVMFVGTLREVLLRVNTESSYSAMWGCTFLFCEEPQVKAEGSLYFYSYIYYLSKYYELLDTILQLLKGRAPPHFFLHVYHHAAVLLMAWAWVEYRMSLQFMGLLFNTGVHVVMYYYYFCRVLGWKVWWKRYVTLFQIVQFFTSFLCCVGTLAFIYLGHECAGSRMLIANLLFNATLLYQFFGVIEKPKKAKD